MLLAALLLPGPHNAICWLEPLVHLDWPVRVESANLRRRELQYVLHLTAVYFDHAQFPEAFLTSCQLHLETLPVFQEVVYGLVSFPQLWFYLVRTYSHGGHAHYCGELYLAFSGSWVVDVDPTPPPSFWDSNQG